MPSNDLCPECGSNPCYLICPTQMAPDTAQSEAEYELSARYDDVRERYAATAEDAAEDIFDGRATGYDLSNAERVAPGHAPGCPAHVSALVYDDRCTCAGDIPF